MKATCKVVMLVALLVVVVGLFSSVFAQEKKITVKELPAAVTAAFKAAYPNAVIKGASTEVEGGVLYYEIESVDGKTKRDLLYTKDGKVFETEETIAAEALPEAVKQAIAKAYPKGKIEKAEKTTKGADVTYDLKVKSGLKTYEVSIDPQGKVLKTEEVKPKEKEKDKKEGKGDKD